MTRRECIRSLGIGSLLLTPSWINCIRSESRKENPHVLLVSGWQTVNIGDIAHTPGMLNLLYSYIPGIKVTLWPNDINLEEEQMLYRYFPELTIVYDDHAYGNKPGGEMVEKAISDADFLLHGSGPNIVGQAKIDMWKERTRKSFGIFGVTIGEVWNNLKQTLEGSSFIYTRETHSIKILKDEGVKCDDIGFAPDATFFMPNRNDESARFYMESRGLESRKFICVAPRSRYTPYHRIHTRNNWNQERINFVIGENQKYHEVDHAKMRHVITHWVRETGNKVVLVPEMEYQTELFEPYLYNPLPDDVKPHIVMHPYWQPDDAASLYAQATCVISAECHSPIISLINGTPAFYIRQPSDTIKGQMYYDLGMDDYVFEIEQTSGQQIADRLMEVHTHRDMAIEKIALMNQKVKEIYDNKMQKLKESLVLHPDSTGS
jgi:polysaccharide pyruvyl transferase WcaK-like protein